MKKIVWLSLLLFGLVSTAPVQAADLNNIRFRLALQWLPQAQFAGYFVAQEKGFYRERGVELTIINGGPDRVVSAELDTGRAEFGTMFLSTALARRATGMPLVNIGQIIQRSSLMLIARADAGIETIADLHQQKVALWANEFQIQPRMLFAQSGIEVQVVPQGSSMDLFLYGAVKATSGMWYNEYHTLLSSGLRESELKPFFLRDTDFDFPEDGIYCLERTFLRHPEVSQAIVAATLEGWRYAFAHEEETLDIVEKRMLEAQVIFSRVHQRWMLRRMRDILMPDGQILESALLPRQVFERVQNQLLDRNVIEKLIDYEDFCRESQQ